MRKFKIWMMSAVMCAALLSGCGSTDSKETTNNNSGQEAENPAASETDSGVDSDSEVNSDSGNDSEMNLDSSKIEFEGTDMEGNKVSADIFSRSKLTMVNVWATYCSPCLNEMPELGEIANEYDPGEFQLMGIISDVMEGDNEEMAELAAGLIEQTGADYTHLLLNESVYKALLTDVSAVPTSFFVDENGEIVDTVVGAMEKEAWEEKINGLLGK